MVYAPHPGGVVTTVSGSLADTIYQACWSHRRSEGKTGNHCTNTKYYGSQCDDLSRDRLPRIDVSESYRRVCTRLVQCLYHEHDKQVAQARPGLGAGNGTHTPSAICYLGEP